MKSSIIKLSLALVIAGIVIIPAVTMAQVPSTDGSNTGGADSAPSSPATDGENTGGADSNGNPSSGDFVPETDGGNTGGADTGTPSDNGSNPETTGSSGGSRRSSRTNPAVVVTSVTPVVTSGANCAYLTSFMKLGGKNTSAEVTKLQLFLTSEGINVDANGVFDQKTADAVKAFQAKYVADIMGPWGVKSPTGNVSYTTQKKINELVCKKDFALTSSQLAQIDAYKANRAGSTVTNGLENASTTIPVDIEVGSTASSSQTASVEGASFFGKMWGFIKWLFGY